MPGRAWVVAGLLAAAIAPPAADARAPRHPGGAQVRPTAFASCASLVGYARRHLAVTRGVAEPPLRPTSGPTPAPQVQAQGQADAVAPSAAGAFSTTNNHEEGVDEPDIVKTDGSTIFTVSGNTLHAVTVGGDAPKLAGSLPLGSSGSGARLLLRGSRLIVISSGAPIMALQGAPGTRPAVAQASFAAGSTVVTEVDAHDPSAMKVTRTMTIDGTFVDARQNGATARLVISSAPRAVAFAAARTRPSGWVPARRFHSALTGRRYTRPVASCDTVRHPAQFSGLGMLTILTIDLDRGLWAADSDALMADAQIVYGSKASLYVATQKWISPSTPVDSLPGGTTTVIDRFDASDPGRTTLVSSGEVPGYLLNQFSLSEDRGVLRVASTSSPIWWREQPQTPSQSFVTVLREDAGRLVRVGQVSGLGRGQQIFSVRFLGDRGYVVTFRQVDPLYTLDLSAPADPKVAGQLELEGYSAYLHPVGDGLLLGIGRAVAASGNEPSGTQLELFDVSDAAAPRLVARTTLGGGSSSQVEYDHHAFLFWAPAKLAVLPIQTYDVAAGPTGKTVDQGFTGAIGYRVDASGIAEVGRITHDAANGVVPAIGRSLVIGDRLFTISDAGVMTSSLDALSRQAFVAFPAPAPAPAGTG
jgi:hypothetical protein